MAEYIDRESVLADIDDTVIFTVRDGVKLPTAEMRGANKVIDRIKSAPAADVVEVVRCKDCVWRIEIPNGTEFKGIKPRYCGLKQELTGENDYCSKGAKMDGKGEGE